MNPNKKAKSGIGVFEDSFTGLINLQHEDVKADDHHLISEAKSTRSLRSEDSNSERQVRMDTSSENDEGDKSDHVSQDDNEAPVQQKALLKKDNRPEGLEDEDESPDHEDLLFKRKGAQEKEANDLAEKIIRENIKRVG